MSEGDGRASARIAVTPEVRDMVRDQKRGGETYDSVLRKMAAQYDPGAGRLEEWTVPLVDPVSGDGWDEQVEADGASEAIQKALEQADREHEPHVATPFIHEHFDVPDGAEPEEGGE